MLRRNAPMIVWCALVLAGTALLIWRPQHDANVEAIATRFLPMNTLVMSGDSAHPGLTGRYVVTPKGVPQGAVLRGGDLADRPTLPAAPPARLLLLLSLPRAAIDGGINVGRKMQLCGKPPAAAFAEVRVEAVICNSDAATSACSVLVEIPSSTAGDVGARGLKDQNAAGDLHLASRCA